MKVAIIGASKDRHKYSNKAVRAYLKEGHVVYPVNPNEKRIEGLECYPSVIQINDEIDIASIYVPPVVGEKIVNDIIIKKIKTVILNPGTDSEKIIEKLKYNNIKAELKCSIWAIGIDPKEI